MDNPEAIISANQKFKKYWSKHSIVYRSPILTHLFTPHLTYDERMIMGRKEEDRRSLS